MLSLTPHAIILPEALQPRLKRSSGGEDDIEQRLVDAINAATHWMEMFTRRRLRARNYRTAVSIACTGTAADATLAGSTFTANVKAGDDLVGVGVAVGSQVDSITSAVALEMTREATATISGSVTFGSRPLYFSGDGTVEAWLHERPLVEVYGLYSTDVQGNRVALNTTAAQYDLATGQIVLSSDIFPRGTLNIQAEVRAGYVQPSATDRGHTDWYALEALAYRVAEVFFMDALNLRGRSDSFAAGGVSANIGTSAMPADILAAIAPFVRRW
jgi:hypothetical protein